MLPRLPLPRWPDGRIVLAVDVSPWLRSDATCSAERLFCHVYGRAKSASQFIPGWPYSFVAALTMGRSSWTAPLDVVRLGPADDSRRPVSQWSSDMSTTASSAHSPELRPGRRHQPGG
ncbi:transposase [Nonomuraea sp. NPDC004186]